jgi:hypothetical protein
VSFYIKLIFLFLLDVELISKIIQSKEIMSSISRIANISDNDDSTTLNDDYNNNSPGNSDIHLLAKRVLNILQEFKNSYSNVNEENRRSSLGQRQR